MVYRSTKFKLIKLVFFLLAVAFCSTSQAQSFISKLAFEDELNIKASTGAMVGVLKQTGVGRAELIAIPATIGGLESLVTKAFFRNRSVNSTRYWE